MANFGRVKTWGAEILQPTDLNAEFDNIINNVTANGLDADNIDETDDYTWSGISVFTNNAAGASGDLLVLTVQTNPASGTATDADGIYMSWKGDDDGGTATEYGRQHLEFDDTGASSEDSSWHLSVMAAATLTDVLTIGHTSAVGTLTLKNQATAVTDGVKLGQINFQAPAESSGTDAILVAASIWAEADDTFAADNNDADLVFAVAESEAAAERMRLAYDGTGTALSFTTATAIDTGGNNALTLNPGTAALTITAGDMTLYDDNNNADASFAIGTSATENLVIAVLNGAANKTAEEVTFTTNTASATADHGKMTFAVDGATVLTIDDGGLSLNGALAIDTGGDNILTLTSGTAHLDVTTGLLDVTGPVTSSGVLSVDDTTETTSGTTGSIHTDGGLGVAKDIYLGDDLLIATGAVFNWAAGDVTLTHAAGKLTFGGDGAVEIDFNNHEMTNVAIGAGATFSPSIAGVLTAENAHIGPIPVMLDDPDMVWDLRVFMQQIRDTSWYAELGPPPIHGVMWINEAKNELVWWDIETDTEYMAFSASISNMLYAVAGLSDVVFLDGVIYACDGSGEYGLQVMDLLRDRRLMYHTAGVYLFKGDVAARNTALGQLALAGSPLLAAATVTAVAACRDPELLDEFGRPKHWWAAGTTGSTGVYSPGGNAIYDSSAGGGLSCTIDSTGGLFVIYSGARDQVAWYRTIYGITADAFGDDETWINTGTKAEDLAWTDAAVFTRFAVLTGKSIAGNGSPMVIFGSDEGLYVAHADASGNDTKGALIRLDADYNSPLMVGDIRACWPLHSLVDVSIKGHTLTNNNAVTFVSGGPAGSYADFVAASSMSLSLADHADFGGMAALSVGLWFYRDIDSGSSEGLISKYDNAGGDGSFRLWINGVTDAVSVELSADSDVVSYTPAITLATWYYVVLTYDGATQRVYFNGELVDSDANTGAVDTSNEILTIGALTTADTPLAFLDGRIAGAFVTATAMTQAQVRYEYQRGLRRLNSTIDANDTIPATDVDGVRVDPNGKYFGVIAGDKFTIFDDFVVPVAQDTAPAGTLNDAGLYSRQGADTPYWFLGTSTRVEIVAPDVRLQDRR